MEPSILGPYNSRSFFIIGGDYGDYRLDKNDYDSIVDECYLFLYQKIIKIDKLLQYVASHNY